MTRPKDWTAGSILVALCAALVASAAMWALLAISPHAAALVAAQAAFTGSCVWAATRNLRARLEATQQVVDAWNSSEARDELAKSPAAGTPTVDPEPPEWMSQSGYRPPRTLATGSVGGWVDLTDKVQSIEITKGPPSCPGSDRPVERAPGEYRSFRGFCPECERVVDVDDEVLEDHPWPYDHPPVEMTVAETDRLIANLHALPEETGPSWGPPDGRLISDAERHDMLTAVATGRLGWHLGQPCATCDAPATRWVSERPDPEISDVTFLCDDHYAAATAEEAER